MENPQQYQPEYLFMEFVRPFARIRFIGGLKGYYPEYENMAHWILRCRFMLTQVSGDILSQLVKMDSCTWENYLNESAWERQAAAYETHTHGAVCWIASLLRSREHFAWVMNKLKRKEEARNERYYTVAIYAALLHYEDPGVITVLNEMAAAPDHSASGLARYAVVRYDRRFGTDFSSRFDLRIIDQSDRRMLDNLLQVGHFITAGIPYQDPHLIRVSLTRLLWDTTSPYERYIGLWNPPGLRAMAEQEQWLGPQSGITFPKARRRFTHISNTDPVFEAQARSYLSAPTPEGEAALKQHLQREKTAQNLLALLEIDQQNTLPLSLVETCFERLHHLLNSSWHLYEKQAIHLLLSGPHADIKAAECWQKAQTIKSHYVMETWEPYRVDIPMFRTDNKA